jgi:hypothetical protein
VSGGLALRRWGWGWGWCECWGVAACVCLLLLCCECGAGVFDGWLVLGHKRDALWSMWRCYKQKPVQIIWHRR